MTRHVTLESRTRAWGGRLALGALLAVVFSGSAALGQTVRASLPLFDADGGFRETKPVVSSNGQFVAFSSDLSNLVSGDSNLVDDVFVRDMSTNTIARVSIASGASGTQGNGLSRWASISADGRYVAFESQASNLVASDTNGYSDIFVRDRQTNTTTRVSVATAGGAQATGGHSLRPYISANGRFVAFISSATNLVAGDTNTIYDVFVHDRNTNTTIRASVATDGTQQTTPPLANLQVPQQGDWVVGATGQPAVSNDGRIVVFATWVSNMVAGDTNASIDVFIRDRDTNTNGILDEVGQVSTVRINGVGSVQPDSKSFVPRITPDGRYIVFESYSISFVGVDQNIDTRDIVIHDRVGSTTTRLPVTASPNTPNSSSHYASISDDGRYVAYESLASDGTTGDTNNASDIFVLDRNTSSITRVSRGAGGALANGHSSNPIISGDGAFIVYESAATNLVSGDTNGLREPFRTNLAGTQQARILVNADGSQVVGGARSQFMSTSGDGRYTAFASTSPFLVSGDSNNAEDVFVYDRQTTQVTLVSVNGGAQIGGTDPSISADGRFVAFTNGDIWLRDRLNGTTTKVSNGLSNAAANGVSREPAISADGRYIAFTSSASNLVASDSNARDDIFVFDRVAGTLALASIPAAGGQSNGHSRWPSISGNGRMVAFQSEAFNLVASDTNNSVDVFVRDRQASLTVRAGVSSGNPGTQLSKGANQPAISANGRYVAFVTNSVEVLGLGVNAFTRVFVRDLQTNTSSLITSLSVGQPNGGSDRPSVSAHGRYVAFVTTATNLFAGDTSPEADVVVADTTVPNTFTRVSSASGGSTAGASDAPAISGDGRVVAFESTAPLVPSDGNRTYDAYVSGRTATADVDTLPGALTTQFKTQFGLVAGIDLPDADPDGDGRTNAQEAADGTHPRGYVSRYLAEGATSTFFSTRLALLNPGNEAAIILTRYLKNDGSSVPNVVNLAGLRRATIDVGTLPGLDQAEFATVVESDALVVVDRTMKWDGNGYGSHAETAVTSPALVWYFAEGATHSNFSLFYLLQNANTSAAAVRVTYLLPSGAPIVRTYNVPARSRTNIWVNQEPGLASTDVSATIEVTNGVPIVAERAMYLTRSGTPTFNAGHESAGVTAASTNWFFAEGATGSYFDLFVLMANPSTTQAATVQARYLLTTGAVVTKNYTVQPSSRFNIWVDFEDPQLANAAVSTTLTSTNGVPIIAERAMWWPNNGNEWFEAHNSAGATTTGTKWALAEGEVGGGSTTETYILIANTASSAASVKVSLYFEDGTSSEKTYPVAANSRFNVPVASEFPSASGRRFGAIVESLGGAPVPIVVERAMYSNGLGTVWAAGTNALGTKLQ